jgi:carbon monoxide dehydrogenase subunit G
MDTILLETGKVKLINENKEISAGVLIDRGSMTSYIRRETAVQLGLKPHHKQPLNVNGFGGHSSKRIYDVAYVNVKTDDGITTIEVLVTNEIVKPIKQVGWDACQAFDYIAGPRK